MSRKKKKKPSSVKGIGEHKIDSFLAFWFLRLEARCDALESLVVFLRKELRLPKSDKTYYGLDELTKEFLQNKLERLEDKDPPLAAEIDRWRTQKDLPDMYL